MGRSPEIVLVLSSHAVSSKFTNISDFGSVVYETRTIKTTLCPNSAAAALAVNDRTVSQASDSHTPKSACPGLSHGARWDSSGPSSSPSPLLTDSRPFPGQPFLSFHSSSEFKGLVAWGGGWWVVVGVGSVLPSWTKWVIFRASCPNVL